MTPDRPEHGCCRSRKYLHEIQAQEEPLDPSKPPLNLLPLPFSRVYLNFIQFLSCPFNSCRHWKCRGLGLFVGVFLLLLFSKCSAFPTPCLSPNSTETVKSQIAGMKKEAKLIKALGFAKYSHSSTWEMEKDRGNILDFFE